MSASQGIIPFKSRKRTHMSTKQLKADYENVNILNTNNVFDKLPKNKDECSPKKIRRTTETTKEQNSIKEKLETAEPKPLASRETEIEWLQNIFTECLDKEESASLYISGQPGTGKTASLTYILNLKQFKERFTQVYINCTMMKSAASIYNRICSELNITTSSTTEKASLSAIEKYLSKPHRMILLVLDEIDQLLSKRQSVLYSVFEWPARADSKLLLVGIANALDLTERTLPRLQARCSLRPRTLHFAPYTKQQIINIFTTLLAKEDSTNVFSPVALQMLAAKIAAISGDMRRALDIGRRVIEMARGGGGGGGAEADGHAKPVELQQVLRVLDEVYGGSARLHTDVEDSLPMHQKLILCSLMLLLTKGKNKDVTVGKLHDVYKRVAGSRNIAPLEAGEVADACALLESRGALRLAGGAGSVRARKLRLQWDQCELSAALRDQHMLNAILADSRLLAAA